MSISNNEPHSALDMSKEKENWSRSVWNKPVAQAVEIHAAWNALHPDDPLSYDKIRRIITVAETKMKRRLAKDEVIMAYVEELNYASKCKNPPE